MLDGWTPLIRQKNEYDLNPTFPTLGVPSLYPFLAGDALGPAGKAIRAKSQRAHGEAADLEWRVGPHSNSKFLLAKGLANTNCQE